MRPSYLICILQLLLTGCTQDPTPQLTTFSGNTMTIDYKIIVGKDLNEGEVSAIKQIVSDTFQEVDFYYNKWNPHSELSTLNRLPANQKAKLSPQLHRLLEITHKIVILTNGRFDPTIEPVQQLWKKHLEQSTFPDQDLLFKISQEVGWNKIHFDEGIFYKDKDGVQIDLGGIAKGYCVDLLAERIHAIGYPDLLVEWGGEMRAFGHHPEGRPWQISISKPGNSASEKAFVSLPLHNEAIATSGDYMQNWTINNVTYFHIIDPATLRPLIQSERSIASASVLAPTCALADGLATAAMLFDNVEEANHWSAEIQTIIPGTQFWFISHSKNSPQSY